MQIQFRYIFFLFLICYCIEGLAQEELPSDSYIQSELQLNSFDLDKWQETKKGISYNKENMEEDDRIDEDEEEEGDGIADGAVSADELSRSYSRSRSKGNMTFWSNFFKFLFILFVILAIAYLAYRLLGDGIGRPKNKKFNAPDTIVSLEEIEENIHEHDFKYYIQQALNENNFALAIRLYYLAILKELSIHNYIHWKREKTNREYLLELRKGPFYDAFKNTTSIFERVWYGNGDLQESDFKRIEPQLEQLMNQVQKTPTTS